MKNNRFIMSIAVLTLMLLTTSGIAATQNIKILGQHADKAVLQNVVKSKLLNAPRYRGKQFKEITAKVAKVGNQRRLVANLKYRNIYYFETAIISLDKNNKVLKIEQNVSPIKAMKLLRVPMSVASTCPDSSVDMVFATPEDGIASAVTGVNVACNRARSAGYRCRTLIGDQATVSNYKRYLANCPKLKAFGNIGHGNTGGILLHDGTLSSSWFNSLPTNKLKNVVNYFNSCKVHNPTLEPAIMRAGTRTYVGGDVNLGIGTSEEVFKCFWTDALVNKKSMKPALVDCESSKYPTTGAHGFSGQQGLFKRMVMRAPAMERVPSRIDRQPIQKPVPEVIRKPIPIPPQPIQR